MRLAQRLLVGSLLVVSVLVVFMVAIASERLRDRLYTQTASELEREARVAAARWRVAEGSDALADSLGAILGHRVTLVDSTGVVRGDSDFPLAELPRLENHAQRPEIVAARAGGVGRSRRASPSRGDDELYVAVRAPLGTAGVAVGTATVDRIVADARRQVLIAGLLATVAALVLAFLFARSVSRPVTELSAVAGAIAGGDLSRRPGLAAPGEIGDLAAALHRMSEQLAARLDALERNDALMTALVDSLDEGVLAIDARGVVVRANTSARAMLAIERDPPFPADLVSRDIALRDALRGALAGEATNGAELRHGDRTLVLTARPLGSGGGAVLALLDLTEIRRLEAVRRDFVANVSHELKTPLTVIGGFAETLADDDPPPEQRRQFVQAIRVNAFRMQRLVDDLLDLSRIESGGWTPHLAVVDLRAAVGDAITAIAGAARAKGVEVEAVVPPDATTLHADPLAIRQILSNLAENAVRYTTAGRITIFARRDGDRITIGVSDTGVGIPPEHVSRIFERFYRVDPGRSRDAGGTGLGLAIVKHLAESHGGQVGATSEVGRGTTVTASFPERRA
ncbi:MAG TPA: ATP-binding protein [Gemmatimonadaceae bacterium]|nr:ATP-binding protein [Gemmatimonadaceae bacterium]